MKTCTYCRQSKPETDFWWTNQERGIKDTWCNVCSSNAPAKWLRYEDYAAAKSLTPEEEYITERLAAVPSLAAGLDAMYKRRPQRWHTLLAGAMLRRRLA